MIEFFVENKSFIAQIIGTMAIAFWVVGLQNKDRKNILLFQAIANSFYSVQYFLLEAYSACSMNFVSTFRCLIFAKTKQKTTKLFNIIFCLIIFLIGVFTYNGLLSLIPLIITIFYTISSSKENNLWNRLTVLLAAFVWIFYNYKVGAYITILGNVFEIISGISAIIRFRNK